MQAVLTAETGSTVEEPKTLICYGLLGLGFVANTVWIGWLSWKGACVLASVAMALQ